MSDTTTPTVPTVPDDVRIVEFPDGSLRAVPVSAIERVESAPTEKQDGPVKNAEPEPEAQFYVHLSNGEVLRVAQSDLPAPGGTNSPCGHWRKGNAVFDVIGVYPVETLVKE